MKFSSSAESTTWFRDRYLEGVADDQTPLSAEACLGIEAEMLPHRVDCA